MAKFEVIQSLYFLFWLTFCNYQLGLLYYLQWNVLNHSVAECPVSDEDDYRIEVLISLRRLERLDKDEYTDDERQEAEEVGDISRNFCILVLMEIAIVKLCDKRSKKNLMLCTMHLPWL